MTRRILFFRSMSFWIRFSSKTPRMQVSKFRADAAFTMLAVKDAYIYSLKIDLLYQRTYLCRQAVIVFGYYQKSITVIDELVKRTHLSFCNYLGIFALSNKNLVGLGITGRRRKPPCLQNRNQVLF